MRLAVYHSVPRSQLNFCGLQKYSLGYRKDPSRETCQTVIHAAQNFSAVAAEASNARAVNNPDILLFDVYGGWYYLVRVL